MRHSCTMVTLKIMAVLHWFRPSSAKFRFHASATSCIGWTRWHVSRVARVVMFWRINSNSNFWMTPSFGEPHNVWATQSPKIYCSFHLFLHRPGQQSFCAHLNISVKEDDSPANITLESSACFIRNMFINITKIDRLGFKREKKKKGRLQPGWVMSRAPWIWCYWSSLNLVPSPFPWMWPSFPPFLRYWFGTSGSPLWVWCCSSSLDLLWIWYGFLPWICYSVQQKRLVDFSLSPWIWFGFSYLDLVQLTTFGFGTALLPWIWYWRHWNRLVGCWPVMGLLSRPHPGGGGRISPLIASYSDHALLLLGRMPTRTQKYLEVLQGYHYGAAQYKNELLWGKIA